MNIQEYRYKTELHLHTSPASKCSEIPPEKAVKIYADLGYHSIVICNHFVKSMRFQEDKKACLDAYLADFDEAVEAGKRYGVHVILGCEIRFPENANDYLLFGIDRDFLDFAYECLDMNAAEFSRVFRSDTRLFIQAHPFRNGMTEVPPEYLDGIEAFNMHPGHNSRVAVANQYAKKHHMITTAGTDYHHPGHEGMASLLTKTKIKTSYDIVDVLRSGDYLFEIGGSIVLP